MTREEIIRNLKYTMEKHKNDIVNTFDTNISVMCKDILEYLEQEPCDVPDINVGDMISKQTVLDTISELNAISFYEAQEDSKECYYEIRQAIKDLSPVKPQTGHWIYIGNGHNGLNKCSECGGERKMFDGLEKYCASCGARMVKPQETKQPEISSYYGLKSYVRERSE